MNRKIRVLIVDDEALARRGIKRLLESEPDFVVDGEAANGKEAAIQISRRAPDLIFLDVQMPLLDGLSLVNTTDPQSLPQIVFVTAYSQHAVQAFEAGAVDYILKPIDPERFKKTLERVRARVPLPGETDFPNSRHLAELYNNLAFINGAYLTRIAIRENERIRLLPVSEIDWIRSDGNYIEIHSGRNTYRLRETMLALEGKLDPREFLRVRHSMIVRIDGIDELSPLFSGDYIISLKDGTKHTTSRRYRKNLERIIKT